MEAEQKCGGVPEQSSKLSLLVSHDEDAVPSRGWFVEEIVLAALPVGARRAFIGPLVENDLKCFLRFRPLALAVEQASLLEKRNARAHIFRGTVDGILPRAMCARGRIPSTVPRKLCARAH